HRAADCHADGRSARRARRRPVRRGCAHGPAPAGRSRKHMTVNVIGRIRESLSRTKQEIVSRFDEIIRLADEPERLSRPVDVATLEALEELLISADIGMAATDRIIAAVRKKDSRTSSLRDL